MKKSAAAPESHYHKVVLDNGVTVVAERHPHVRSVSIGVWVKTGSVQESASTNGISHFIEHMVFKGTEKRSPLEIATVLESLGGDLNAFTDRELTCFHATALSEHLEQALDVLSDLVLRPLFPRGQIDRERKVVLQEMSMVEDSPDEWIGDLFFATVWKNQPLGRPIIGTRKNIQSLSRAQILSFFKEYYRPENIVISVAGDVDFAELTEKCAKYFSFPAQQKMLPLQRPKSIYKGRHRNVSNDSEQLHLLLGFEGLAFNDPYRFDGLILSFFLGGGMSSRLFQEIREVAALAYSVDCDCVPFMDTGLFTFSVGMAPKSLKECMKILTREVENLKKQPLTEKDLGIVKGQLKGTILLSSDQMEVRQESLGRNELVFGRYIPVEEVIGEIERVTPERIQALAQRLFVPEKEAVVTLGPERSKVYRPSLF
ncbi:insulinase family protein [bacterium]|nr:insulinase family protein [bacterium]